MKTILFVSPTGTFDNGAEISIFNFEKYLNQLGYTVLNVCPRNNNQDYIDRHREEGIQLFQLDALNWWWEDAPGEVNGNISERSYYYRQNISEIREIIKKNEVDILISNTVNVFQGAVAAACESKKHFWLIHEFPEGEFAYYRSKIDFIEEYSDEIFSVSGLLNEQLSDIFKKEVKSFIPYTEIKETISRKSTTSRIVSVGRLTDRKNQIELLKAYKELDRPEVELVFIGAQDKEYKKICDDFISENKLRNITFTGNLEEPWEELTDKDIFVSTSAMETFGLVYVEALLKGIPTIISDNPGYNSVYKIFGQGKQYHLGEAKQLADYIQEALDNFELLKEESLLQTKEVQKKYSLDKVYEEICKAIENGEDASLRTTRHIGHLVSVNESVNAKSLGSKIKRKIKKILIKR